MDNQPLDHSKQQLTSYLRIIEGQVRGLQVMLLRDTYCIDVLMQTNAIKQALSRIEDALMRNHLIACSMREIKNGNEDVAVNEILKVYQLKRR